MTGVRARSHRSGYGRRAQSQRGPAARRRQTLSLEPHREARRHQGAFAAGLERFAWCSRNKDDAKERGFQAPYGKRRKSSRSAQITGRSLLAQGLHWLSALNARTILSRTAQQIDKDRA